MAGRALLLRAEPGFSLPAFERFAPPPAPAVVAARIEAHSAPGDIVLDLHGRGGWIARAAIDRQRTAVSLESTPLDRLLAEIVLRPPDLRHLDAAIQGLAASARRESSLKTSITDRYASRCATCDRSVVLDEVTWEVADDPDAVPVAQAGHTDRPPDGWRPVRSQYRCAVCRDQLGGGEVRHAPADPAERRRAADPDVATVRARLRERFPVLDGGEALADDLLDLHTPRQLVALAAILERIEGDLRAAPVAAALRLAFLHALGPASRLAGTGGRVTALRIAHGRVRPPSSDTWRERNPWTAFEDGVRLVRGFVQRLEGGTWGPVPARLGEDLRSLAEGGATVVLRGSTPAAYGALGLEAERQSGLGVRARVRLVLGAPPLRPSADRLAWAYQGTSWVLGREAAATLSLEPLFGPAVKAPWAWQAAALARSLGAVEPALARDARVVLLLDPGAPESLAAAALAGATAGYRLVAARHGAADGGDGRGGGTLELAPPGSGAVPGGPRTRANVALDPVPGGAGDPDLVPAGRLFAPPERVPNAPFSAVDAARAVVDAAVEVMKLRGEPVTADGLLGEVLVGLDRAGHLRRLVRSPGTGDAVGDAGGPAADGQAAGVDHVERLLALVRDALAGAEGRRLVRLDGDRWWLGDRTDRDAAAVPLADRVEWAVYSVLSTAGPIAESAFLERIANLFTGPDLPDEALVRACLESYRSRASTPDGIVTADDLQQRSQEHAELLGSLADLGHRLGMRCWIGARHHRQLVAGRPLGERLDGYESSGPPFFGRVRAEDLEDVDVVWYVRGRLAFLWEVEWTAMLGDPLLRRHARHPADERIVRFLVIPPERTELVRHKLDRSPLLRDALRTGAWHLLKANHLRAWAARDRTTLDELEPLLGLDPPIERTGDQLPLFGG
jgi:hypothetical protein